MGSIAIGGTGSGGTPSPPTGAIQFDNAGAFGGNSDFTYTGPTTTGSATNTDGINILGTLNTTGNVDGAVIFANITNTASGANTTIMDLQVNSSSVFNIDMSGDIFLSGNRAITSSTGLTIQQTGDVYGPTGFVLQNRNGANGAIFSQSGTVSVVDFIFLINGTGGFNGQNNLRYERRPSFFVGQNVTYEFQFGISGSSAPNFFAGDTESGTWTGSAPNALFSVRGTNQPQLEFRAFGGINNMIKAIRLNIDNTQFFGSHPVNTLWELQLGVTGSFGGRGYTFGDTACFIQDIQFADNLTGAGNAALGANCPAVTPGTPYTWNKGYAQDGSVVYFPLWK